MLLPVLPRLTALITALLGAAPVHAANDPLRPIPQGHCVLVVASRPLLSDVRDYILTERVHQTFLQVFPSSNGWYAITVGALRTEAAAAQIARRVSQGEIPGDSFCSRGREFAGPLDWRKMLARERFINAQGYLEQVEPDGTRTEISLGGSDMITTFPDGTQEFLSFVQVGHLDLPPLSEEYGAWSSELEDAIDALSARALLPHEHRALDAATPPDFFEGALFRLRTLRGMVGEP